MTRALQFKIALNTLTLKDVADIHHKDLDFITENSTKNSLEWFPDDGKIRFTGKNEDLFTFLYDVAYKYDIEIM